MLGAVQGFFPDRRLYCHFVQAVKEVIAAGAPINTQITPAAIQSKDPKRTFHLSKDSTAFWSLSTHLFRGEPSDDVLALLDFTNLEKPYDYRLEALSTLKALRVAR